MATILQDIEGLITNIENWLNSVFNGALAVAETDITNTLNANQSAFANSLTTFTTNAVQQAVQNALNQVAANITSSSTVNQITSGINVSSGMNSTTSSGTSNTTNTSSSSSNQFSVSAAKAAGYTVYASSNAPGGYVLEFAGSYYDIYGNPISATTYNIGAKQ
ncbi:MAG: hypothetical protein QXW39_06185 [Candidatus Bathyarchaeia archaeon]